MVMNANHANIESKNNTFRNDQILILNIIYFDMETLWGFLLIRSKFELHSSLLSHIQIRVEWIQRF